MIIDSLKIFVMIVGALAGRPGTTSYELAIQHAPAIWHESRMVGENPILTAAQIKVETKFDHTAVGLKGERGLLQVLPKIWVSQCSDILPYANEPWAQIRCGLRVVKIWRSACGGDHKPETWLGGYNAGYPGCGVRTKYTNHVLNVKVKRAALARILRS